LLLQSFLGLPGRVIRIPGHSYLRPKLRGLFWKQGDPRGLAKRPGSSPEEQPGPPTRIGMTSTLGRSRAGLDLHPHVALAVAEPLPPIVAGDREPAVACQRQQTLQDRSASLITPAKSCAWQIPPRA
jgi:hypothetical protein